MNQNYNLMRLANLYGGMNKYAVSDAVTAHLASLDEADKKQAELEKAKQLAIAANNAGKAQNAADLDALLARGVSPEQAIAIVAGKGKTSPVEFKGVGAEEPHATRMGTIGTYWDKAVNWTKENPWLAGGIGAGALGLGGLGAYYALKDDEEEEGRKKSAGYIDPYVAQVLAHDYITKMASANGIPSVAAGVTGLSNYLNLR